MKRRILRRFMRGHVPLLLAALNDGVRAGELDGSVPVPLMLIAFVGIAALPQVVRRGAGAVARLALPGEQPLAEASIAIFWRAFGA